MPPLLSRSSIVAGALLGALVTPAAAQEKDELWEITMKMEMPGMGFALPPSTSRICVAKGANDESFMPQKGECRNVESKRTGNKYTFKIVCEGKDKVRGTGEITFGDGTYDGKMQMTALIEGQPMNVTQTYSGKRVGSCTAPPKPK